MESILGTIWFTILVFVAGTVCGAPLWAWAKKFLPWNK